MSILKEDVEKISKKKIITDCFYSFIKNPNEKSVNFGVKLKWLNLALSFVICIIGVILASILSVGVFFITGDKIFQQRESFSLWKSLFENAPIVVLIAPITEEIAFRLYLKRKKINIFISLTLLCYFLLCCISKISFYKLDTANFTNISLALTFSFLLFIFGINKYFTTIKYKYLFWFSCSSFALMHLLNFTPLSTYQFIFFSLLILPQFIYGIVMGYLRVKQGLIWSILLHILINGLPFCIKFLT